MRPLLNAVFGGSGPQEPSEVSHPDAAVEAAAAEAAAQMEALEGQTAETLQLIEGDLVRVSRNFSDRGETLAAAAQAIRSKISETNLETQHLVGAVEAARGGIDEMSTAANELSASTGVINERIATAEQLTDSAVQSADVAHDGVRQLEEAIGSISGIVSLISDIAKQTNLLALNATIEAARAGAAGKGFAVVASEVKSLSDETQRATEQISRSIATLKDTASASAQSVDGIVDKIKALGPTFQEINAAVADQSASVATMHAGTESVNADIGAIEACCDAIGHSMTENDTTAENVGELTASINSELRAVGPRFVMLIRQTRMGDRREHDRLPAVLPGIARFDGIEESFETIDVSKGGMLLAVGTKLANIVPDRRLEVDFAGVGALEVTVRNVSSLGVHCQIIDKTSDAYDRFVSKIQLLAAENEAAISLAQDTASQIADQAERLINSGSLSERDTFDTNYQAISGTEPSQYSTRYLSRFESFVPSIIEPAVKKMANCVFVLPIDLNGYIPVHNEIYSKPQRPGEVTWNTANCRNKRIFDDRAGLSAGRNTRPYLIQVYPRDMGGGKVVWLKEVDAPIYINGRHWGGVRVALKL